MGKPYYPWYPYIKNLLRNHKHSTEREREAVLAALEATDPETRFLIDAIYTTGEKTMHAAAGDLFISYQTAQRRTNALIKDVARRLNLL